MKTAKKLFARIKNKNRKAQLMIGLIIATMAAGIASPAFAQSATKWPINKYRIIQQAPSKPRLHPVIAKSLQAQRDNGMIKTGLTTAQMRVLEQYFAEVGKEYQRLGFLDPKIDTVAIDKKLGKVFEIFVFDYPDTGNGPARYGPCGGVSVLFGIKYNAPKRYIRLDLDRIYSGNSIAPITYDNIAHEMFHAVQRSYPLFEKDANDGCNLGDWIMEATAEAVGADTALKLKGVQLNEIKMGQRKYSKPLYVQHATGATKNRAYWTASFWRYIGEYVSNGKKFPSAAKQNSEPNYRYLQKFFTRTVNKSNAPSEMSWLEDNLEAELKLSLANLYSNFVTTFAHYVPDRTGGQYTDQAGKAYREKLFEKCERVTLDATTKIVTTKVVEFGIVSSRCFEVIYTGPANKIDVQISFNKLNVDSELVRSIHRAGVQYVDAGGNKKISVMNIETGEQNKNGHLGQWRFQDLPFPQAQHSGGVLRSNVFIVSNVAKNVWETRRDPVVAFEISYSKSTGTMTYTKVGQ